MPQSPIYILFKIIDSMNSLKLVIAFMLSFVFVSSFVFAQEAIDTDGFSPLTPGCLLTFKEPMCSGWFVDYLPDTCVGLDKLQEVFTTASDGRSCAAPTYRFVKCSAYCVSIGYLGGNCVQNIGYCPILYGIVPSDGCWCF